MLPYICIVIIRNAFKKLMLYNRFTVFQRFIMKKCSVFKKESRVPYDLVIHSELYHCIKLCAEKISSNWAYVQWKVENLYVG